MNGNPSFLVISPTEEIMNNIILAEETMGQRIKTQRILIGIKQEQLARHLTTLRYYLMGFEKEEPYTISAIAILQVIKYKKS